MSFKLELTDNQIIKSCFESISNIVAEITLIFDSEGMRLTALDKSHITFVTLELQAGLFDTYNCDKPEKVTIDADKFYEILKKCKTNDILMLSVDEGDFIITFQGDAVRRFKLHLIDIEYEPQTPPIIEYNVNIMVPSGMVQSALKDMTLFNENLQFLIDEDYFKIISTGDLGDVNIDYLHGEHITEVVRASYTIKKLDDIFRASKFSKECMISLGDAMPLTVTFELPTRDGRLSFMLAPRIQEDE